METGAPQGLPLYSDEECLKERKWWCFLLSSIFTFILGVLSVLLVRGLQAVLRREVSLCLGATAIAKAIFVMACNYSALIDRANPPSPTSGISAAQTTLTADASVCRQCVMCAP